MAARPLYLGTDVLQRARDAEFSQRAERDIWKLGFDQQAESDISGLSKLIEPPKLELQNAPEQEPLPIMVSDRPDALALQQQAQARQAQQQPVPTENMAAPQPAAGQPAAMPSQTAQEGVQQAQAAARPMSAPTAGGNHGEIDNSSRQAFIKTAYPYMLEAAGGDPNLAELMLAKAISENGSIGTGRPFWANNFSGIKGEGDAGSVEADTWEDYGNGPVNIRDKFAAYSTPQAGMAAFMGFLRDNSRYHPALARYEQTGDASQLFRDILAAGYATDKAWADKVESIRANQVAPVVRGSSDMQRVSLNAAPASSPAPGAAAPEAAGVPPAPAASPPPSPWANEQAGNGPLLMKSPTSEGFDPISEGFDPSSEGFAPGDGGFAPQTSEQPYDPDQGAREATPGSVGSQPLPQTAYADPTVSDPAYTQDPTAAPVVDPLDPSTFGPSALPASSAGPRFMQPQPAYRDPREGQGIIARGIDVIGQYLPSTPIVETKPGDAKMFMGEQPASIGTPWDKNDGLWQWRGRLAEGTADALARGLGQDPDQLLLNVTIGGVPIQMSVSELLENVTDPLLGAGFGVGDMVLDAAGKAVMRLVAPYAKGAARETIGRLLNAEPVQRGVEAVREGAEAVGRGLGEAAQGAGRYIAGELMDMASPMPRAVDGGPGIGRALADGAGETAIEPVATRGSVIASQIATDVGNSLAGGMGGATVGAFMPADSDQQRLENMRNYGIAGAVGYPLLGRGMARSGGTLATFGASPGYQPPSAARAQAAAAQGVRRGQQLNRAVSAPPSEVPAGVRAATVATDDRAAMRWAEDMLSDAAGSPRMRENDPARPSTMSRVNAGAVANERIANELEPAIVNAGRAGLQDELPQHLEDMHQKDILDEFYRRGHQEVMDDRAQAITTAQARGASPATIQRMQAKAQTDAHAAGLRKMRQRQGSDPEMAYEAIEARLQAQEQRVTAAGKKQELDDAAQAIWDHNAETRQRLVDAGEMDPTDAAHYAQVYPHYVPTVPISHLDARGGQAVSASSGTRVSRGNQGVVKALEDVGTSGERLNPIVASRNATVRAERAIQRNNVARAFAQMMDDALQASPSTMGTNAATHRTFLGGGVDVTFFDNGKPMTISVPKPVADGLEAAANMGMSSNGLASIWKRVMGAVTSTMTAARASFLPVNLLRDVQDFATRTMAREGGPQNLPSIMRTWADEAGRAAADIALAQMTPRGIAGASVGAVTGAAAGDENKTPAERLRDAFSGGVAGTFLLGANRVNPTGNARQFMARGGGSGALSSDWRVGQRWYRDVMRQGGMPIKSPSDLARFFSDWGGDILSLQGVKGINERTELISRTAAMRRADSAGSDPVEAMIAGRDATVDFDRAGTWARMVNGIVPFFNATVQGGAQTARAIRNNPVAFSASIAATLGPVMLGAEAWNRSDPTRAAVYDDVPQYVKDTGIVVVTPWAGSDTRGERPNYLWIPTGMTTPFVIGMRAAMESLPGLEPVAGRVGTQPDASTPEKWLDVFNQVAQVFSPIRGDSAASVASNFVPPIAKQVVELGQNKDMFRSSPIASDSADERASTFGRRVAEGANAAGQMVGNDFLQEVRPSQVDYLARQLPAYGDIITGASDMVAPNGFKQAEDRPIQNAPFAGGMVGRFVRDTGGANIQRAQDAALSDGVREVFEAAGMRPSELAPVPSRWKNGTLTREEQLRWQDAFNGEIGRAMAAVRRDPNWRDPAKREQAVKDALSQARERAAERARLPGADVMERRIRSEQRMKAS